MISHDTNNILSILNGYTLDSTPDISIRIASDFRKRRIEKNITRNQMADMSGVAPANIARFEQKGLISLSNLIRLAVALGYTGEISSIFSESKYATMEELSIIRKNTGKKKASGKTQSTSDENGR